MFSFILSHLIPPQDCVGVTSAKQFDISLAKFCHGCYGRTTRPLSSVEGCAPFGLSSTLLVLQKAMLGKC